MHSAECKGLGIREQGLGDDGTVFLFLICSVCP